MRTRLFQAWFRLSRSMTLGVRAIVERADGQVLLVRHTYVKGLFLPGGGVERGEPAATALQRELIEEAGVRLTGLPQLMGVYSNHSVFPNDHVLLYRVRDWQETTATSTGEIAERVWVNPKALPNDTTPGTARRLGQVYGPDPQPPSDYW